MMNRRYFLTAVLCAPLALGVFGLRAEAKPQWEDKWYPVKDGQQNKLYVRFGSENGFGLRQWGNGYDVKVKFTARIVYKAEKGTGFNMTMESLSLEPGGRSEDAIKYIMSSGELFDITAVIE